MAPLVTGERALTLGSGGAPLWFLKQGVGPEILLRVTLALFSLVNVSNPATRLASGGTPAQSFC